jgi:FeS assembly SUF system regulator
VGRILNRTVFVFFRWRGESLVVNRTAGVLFMLRVAKLTDYAIVVLAHMAKDAHICVHPTASLAEAVNVPLTTVQKVMKTLTRGGLTLSVRGARGGYSLARDPATITLVEVIEIVEGPLAMTACATAGVGVCGEEHQCAVSGHWPIINHVVRTALQQVSVLDVSRPPGHGARRNTPMPTLPTSVEG